MKKIYITIIAMLLPLIAKAQNYDAYIDGIYYNFNSSTMTATVTYHAMRKEDRESFYDGKIFIPSSVTYNGVTYTVTTIGSYAFYDCNLTSVTIPRSVTSIGQDAFKDCRSLAFVTIPNSVTSIGESAFEGCSGLSILFSDIEDPFKIDNSVFDGIPSNAQLVVPKLSIDKFMDTEGWNMFSKYESLDKKTNGECGEEVVFSYDIMTHTLTISGEGPMYDFGDAILYPWVSYCIDIRHLIIESGVTSIANYAFEGGGLMSVTIGNSVTSINSCAFMGCGDLTSVVFGNNVISIGNSAFSSCGLTSVIIPNSVTSISDLAFFCCNNLTSVTIGKGLASIGSSVFNFCNLSSIIVDEGNPYYDSRNNCNAIIDKNNQLIIGCKNTIIPNSVTSINEYAFMFCSDLISVTIPNSVYSIGNGAFTDCSGLTTIYSLNNTPPTCEQYYGDNTQFDSVDKTNCVVWVPNGCANAYKEADGWKDFQNIRELAFGDVNIDFEVNQADLDATVDFIMGKDPGGFYESLADLNGDDVEDAADVVKLVTILNLQDGLSMEYQAKYSNQVISSLSCTLNNDGDKAIQLTKCELYCNQSLVSSVNFKVTLASGGSKKCSFDELESLSSRTGFSVVWYYTYNSEDYTYRCEITE